MLRIDRFADSHGALRDWTASSMVTGGRLPVDPGEFVTGAGGADPGGRAGRNDGFWQVPAQLSGRYRWSGISSGVRGLRAGEEGVMDPITVAFGTALVGAIATSAWQGVRDAVTGLWRRVHPRQQADDIGTELDELRERVLAARRDGDADTERALEGVWQLRLQELLRADPALAAELRRVLDQVLTPALTSAEQARVGTIIMTGSSHDSSTLTQIGNQVNYNRP